VSGALLLSIFTSDILPIFVVAGIGFVLAKYFDVSVKTLSRVTFYALVPSLVFMTLTTSAVSIGQFGRITAFCFLVAVIAGLIARLTGAALRLDRPALIAFVLVVMISNNGNYGLPVVLFAFGNEALTYASVYFIAGAILTYTVGVFLAASGRRTVRHALMGLTRVPVLYSVAAAAVVMLWHIAVPIGLVRPIGLLGQAAMPMMMLVLGMQLERASMPERPASVAAACVLSLVITPLIAIGVAALLGLSGPARQAAILQASMPAAVVTTILALEFDVAPGFVTSVVFVTTALSPFTLTAIIAFLQSSS
jgi:predicted permease